jgi:hypothetical protein
MAQTSRILRLLALAAVVAVAYFAQYIFDHGTLQALYPSWLLERLPILQRTTLWLADDLHTLALWLYAGCALLFGLLVPGWEEQPAGMTPGGQTTAGTELQASGAGAWAWLGAILLFTAAMTAWGWTSLPAQIAPEVAEAGLQAQALFSGSGGWLAAGATGAPRIAQLPTAVGALLLGSGLAGAHLVGLLAALATVAATYLLAEELFRLSPQRRGLALFAAGFTGATVVLLQFGRMAPFLPPTALGVLAAWSLLRGQRTSSITLLAASGALAAVALWLDRSGLVFAPVLLLWWFGYGLNLGQEVRQQASTISPSSRGRSFVLWLAGYLVVAAPLLAVWLFSPSALHAYWSGGAQGPVILGDWWANLRSTVTTLFWTPDASTVFGYDGHFVQSIVAPLFVLGTGALLLNLDRLVGWCVLTWLGCVLLLASAASPIAPYWPLLVPLLPLVGITVMFALERMGALWVQASHEPGSSAAASLAGGLLAAVVVFTWIGYYGFATANGDGPSYTGRALATLPSDAVAVLVASAPEHVLTLDDPVLRFVAGTRVNQALAVGVDALPATLPTGSQIIVQGADNLALSAARARYPTASVEVTRDLQANPRLFVLLLP